MTVEELEIIVTAKVEEALKDFGKLAPEIKKQIKQIQEMFSNVDTTELNKKVEQATNLAKKKIRTFKKSVENNEVSIKANNTNVKEKVDETKKMIDSIKQTTSLRL